MSAVDSLEALSTLCRQVQNRRALHIESPPEQPRRACVAAILRCRPSAPVSQDDISSLPKTTDEFFEQTWVRENSTPEILYIQRATRESDRWSGHVAFPGGKNEAGETDMDTVARETFEEIGLDLQNGQFLCLGKLDEREITSTMNGNLMMILVPFVFLQLVPDTPPLKIQESEVATVQWVPFDFFLSSADYPDQRVKESLAPAKRKSNGFAASLTRHMLGSISFPAIDLPSDDESRPLRLWGLTLGMTCELIELTVEQEHHSEGRPAWQQTKLAFVKLARSAPVYSVKEVGYLVRLIAYVTGLFSARPLDRRARDKIYFASLRRGIYAAVLWRVAAISILFLYALRKSARLLI